VKKDLEFKIANCLKHALLLLPFLLVANANAQQLTLKQAIDYSLKNHPSTRIYQNNIAIANQQAREGISTLLPQVNGNATLDDNIKRQTTILPGVIFGSPRDVEVQFGNQYSSTATVQADQTIFDVAAIYGVQANKPNKEMAQVKLEQNNETLIYNTAQAFYQVLIYTQQEKLLAENERKFTELNNLQKLQLEKGVLKKVDYDRIRVNLNNIISQRKLAQTNLLLALNRLTNAMGMPLNANISIQDSIDYKQEFNLPNSASFQINKRPEYRLQELNAQLQEIDLKRKRAAFFPTLGAYARYGVQAMGNELSSSYDNTFDFATIGLKLNVPIFSGFRKYSQLQQSQLNLFNAKENLKINASNLELANQNSNTQLFSSYTNLLANQENLALAKDVFDVTNLQYKNGVVSLSDLLNADFSYKEAQTNYISSLLNFLTARIDVERVNGTLNTYINQL
jgi:outer membrane protein TolC